MVSLGKLASDVQRVELVLPVKALSGNVTLNRAKGSCSCFLGARMPDVITPGSDFALVFEFDLSPFVESGKWTTDVALTYSVNSPVPREYVKTIQINASFDLAGKLLFVPPRGALKLVRGDEDITISVYGEPELTRELSVDCEQTDEVLRAEFSKSTEGEKRGRFMKLGVLHVSAQKVGKRGFSVRNVVLNVDNGTVTKQSVPLDVLQVSDER